MRHALGEGGRGGGGCRRAAAASTARPMVPTPLAPLDPHKTRALTTIYAPRKLKTRKNKTAHNRMLDNDLPVKTTTLSPFHPLPAIGQKLERSKTKVIVFDLDRADPDPGRVHDVFKPLTPLRIHGYVRKKSLDHFESRKPQQLLRENTYDVIDPIYLHTTKEEEPTDVEQDTCDKEQYKPKDSPKTRFKKAAIQVAKLTTMPETGKLLCMREREIFNVCRKEEDKSCKLERLPQSPEQKLNEISEIFQNLEMRGRHRDKMKKENSWF